MTCPGPVYLCSLSGGRFAGASNARSITVSPEGSRLLAGGPPGSLFIDEFDLTSGAYISDFADGWSPRFAPDGTVYWAEMGSTNNEIRNGFDDTSDVFVWVEPDASGTVGVQQIEFRPSPFDGLLYVVDQANVGGGFAGRRIYQVDPSSSGATQIATGIGSSGSTAIIEQKAPVIASDGAVWFRRDSIPGRVGRWDGSETQWVQDAALISPGCVLTTVILVTTISSVTGAYSADPSFATTREAGYDDPPAHTSYEDYALTEDGTLYVLNLGDIYVVPRQGWLIGAFN